MSKISDFASNSIMGVVRKIVNHIVDNVDPQISDATDHLPARFSGTFNDSTRNLTMTIESQGPSAENLVATVNIPAGEGGSGGPTYSAGSGITITPENAIEIDTAVTATKQSVDTLQAQVGDAFTEVAIGGDGKSLDFTALDGQVNNILLPSSDLTFDVIGINGNLLNTNETYKTNASNLFAQYRKGTLVYVFGRSPNFHFVGILTNNYISQNANWFYFKPIGYLYPNMITEDSGDSGTSTTEILMSFNFGNANPQKDEFLKIPFSSGSTTYKNNQVKSITFYVLKGNLNNINIDY